jgi:hypothetical protein
MFADLVPQPRTLARAALTVAYLGLMLVLAVVAWQGGKVDLSSVGQVFGALGAGLLGAVINPSGSKKSSAPAGSGNGARETDVFWAFQTVVGCAALLMTALALAVNGSGHANAPAAFTAVAAAFSALFLDTSSVTHPLTEATGSSGAPATSDAAGSKAAGSGAGGGAATGGAADGAPATGAGEAPKAHIPSQSTGSADDAESPNG